MDTLSPSSGQLFDLHEGYKCVGLNKPQLEPADLERCLDEIFQSTSADIRKRLLGQSVLGKPIYKITIGKGDIRVLCWSQMHGDESTATSALLDILQVISVNQGKPWLDELLSKLTIHIVPMLNPDGAHYHSRENHQGIDINRDVQRLQSPEGRLLKDLIDSFQPQYAFNLHDQSRYYAIAGTGKPVTLAFMAPPGDEAESLSAQRLAAMQLIGRNLLAFAPQLNGQVAKYVDGYSNKAFGDYATGQGVATILIESGELPKDPSRQLARRLNFAVLLHSFSVIAAADKAPLAGFECHYAKLPVNQENGLYDVFIQHLHIGSSVKPCKVDVGLRYCSQNAANCIEHVGDLASKGGLVEFNAQGALYDSGKTFYVEQPLDLTEQTYIGLLKQGYCRFGGDISLINQLSCWPIVQTEGYAELGEFLRLRQPPSWLIKDRHNVIAAVLNGELIPF